MGTHGRDPAKPLLPATSNCDGGCRTPGREEGACQPVGGDLEVGQCVQFWGRRRAMGEGSLRWRGQLGGGHFEQGQHSEGQGYSRGAGAQCWAGSQVQRGIPCGQRGGHLGPPSPTAPTGQGGRSHRLLRWPLFFFFFFLGGGDAELLDQRLVLGEGAAEVRGLPGPS